MSLVLKDPKSNNDISAFLRNAQKRHSELSPEERFLRSQTAIDLADRSTSFAQKVANTNASEGAKINYGSIFDSASHHLRKHNTLFLNIVNGKIDFGFYPASVRLSFGMALNSPKLPSMTTHDEIMTVSGIIASGTAVLNEMGLDPPQDFTAAANLVIRNDVNDKISDYNESIDLWKANVLDLAISKAFCRELAVIVRTEIQFHAFGQTEEQIRDYCRSFGVVYASKKDTTEIDVLALFADSSGIALGTTVRVGKLVIAKNKVKKIEAVQGVTKTVNSHGEAILVTSQTGDLYLVYECPGCLPGHVPITIVEGEDQSLTIHLVKSQPEE